MNVLVLSIVNCISDRVATLGDRSHILCNDVLVNVLRNTDTYMQYTINNSINGYT